MLFAQGDISAGNITVSNMSVPLAYAGAVDIKSNLGGASSPFVIGLTGQTNGVGTITTNTGQGGGIQAQYTHGGVYVTNGTANSTGDITVNASSSISVTATASKAGFIILNANVGTITLPPSLVGMSRV